METDCEKQHGSCLKTGIPAFGDTATTRNRYTFDNNTRSKDLDDYVISRIDVCTDQSVLCHGRRPVCRHREFLISPTRPF
jgi:hypothetical protein